VTSHISGHWLASHSRANLFYLFKPQCTSTEHTYMVITYVSRRMVVMRLNGGRVAVQSLLYPPRKSTVVNIVYRKWSKSHACVRTCDGAGRDKTITELEQDIEFVQWNPLTIVTADLFQKAIAERHAMIVSKAKFKSQSLWITGWPNPPRQDIKYVI